MMKGQRAEALTFNPFYLFIHALLKRTNNGAGPSGLAVISLQKVDSLIVLVKTRGSKKVSVIRDDVISLILLST